MELGEYIITLKFTEAAVLPEYAGSMLRGALGAALKSVMCARTGRDCQTCRIGARCLYAVTYERFADTATARRPRPFVIEPPEDRKTDYGKDDTFSFKLVLFGELNRSVAFFIHACDVMGRRGLGRLQEGPGRPACMVEEVRDVSGCACFDPASGMLAGSPQTRHLSVDLPTADRKGDLRLHLKTPLRLKHANHLQSDLPFHVLIRGVLGRISGLFSAFAGGEPDLPYRELVARAGEIDTLAGTLRWRDWTRYSSRQQERMQLGGLLGEATYPGVDEVFIALLDLARLLHVGKQTTFGLGRIEYEYRTESDRL